MTSVKAHAIMAGWATVAAACVLVGCRAPRPPAPPPEVLQRESLTLLKMLCATHDDAVLRAAALSGLAPVARQDIVRPWILQGLSDPHAPVRVAGCLVLGRLGDQGVVPAFQRLLADEDDVVRGAALWALIRCGAEEHRSTLEQLCGASAAVRRSAAAVPLLLEVNQQRTAAALRAALPQANPLDHAWIEAARIALLNLGDPGTTQRLRLQARSGDARQQQQAVEMLAHAIDPTVLDVLRDRLESGLDLAVRLAAAGSLSRFDSSEGLPLAMQALQYNDADTGATVRLRAQACRVCGMIGDRAALAPLGELLFRDRDPEVRVACASAILRILARPDGSIR